MAGVELAAMHHGRRQIVRVSRLIRPRPALVRLGGVGEHVQAQREIDAALDLFGDGEGVLESLFWFNRSAK